MCDDSPHNDLSLLEPIFERHKDDPHSLISILQEAQAAYGWLGCDVIRAVARHTGLTPAKVVGVATFYAQFRLEPVGRHTVMLCKGTACHVNGADSIEKALNECGLFAGSTTEDGEFSFETVACLGCCSLSPVMTVDGEVYGSLTPSRAKEIIAGVRGGGK